MLAIGGGILTLGLIRPWGEAWPRWIPVLAGRRVPVAVPAILGGVAALAITVGGLAFVRLAIIGALRLAPEPAEPPTSTGWATWSPGWLWPFWGIASPSRPAPTTTAAATGTGRLPAFVAGREPRVEAP